MAPSVLLIGASGSIGVPVVEQLIAHKSSFGRIGILADPARASKFDYVKKNGIEVVLGSYLDANCYKGFDVAVSFAGNAIMRLQPAMIEAAIAGGVRHFYPSEYGSDTAQDALANFRYFRDKRVTRDHLVAKAKEYPDFRFTYIMCGPLTEWILGPYYGVDVKKHTVTTYGSTDQIVSLTALKDVARYIVESILLPFAPKQAQKREIRVVGENIAWEKIVETLEEVYGVRYQVTCLPVELAAQKEEEARKKGDEEQEMLWSFIPFASSGFAIVPGPLDNDKFSFKPESVRETFIRVIGSK